MTPDSRTAMAELNEDEQAAFVLLSEYELTNEQIRKLITESFRQRHHDIVLPTPPPHDTH